MDLSERPITLRDGSPGVSWLTPTLHRGRILAGSFDVHVRPLTLSETPMNDSPTNVSGSSNSHARLSPSSSKQWTHCTASIAFAEANKHRIPKDSSSAFSNEGTIAHEHAANVLLNNITIDKVPEDFRPYVAAYVDHCLATVPDGISYQTEVVANLFYQPESTGTCDFAVVTDDLVVIRDLKYGAGVLVSAHENTQLAVYALSLIRMMEDLYNFQPNTVIDIGIFQPRHREAQDAEPWLTTLAELESFCKAIEYAAIQAHTGLERVQAKLPCGQRNIAAAEVLEASPMVKFHAEDGDEGSCRWCKAKAICEIRLAAAVKGMGLPDLRGEALLALLPDLSKEELKAPVDERITLAACEVMPPGDTGLMISDDYLVKIHERSKAIRRFLDDIEEHLEARALAGSPATGTKLVEGRMGNRAWANEDAADTFLKGQKLKEDERYNFKLKSPTEIEKVLAAKLKASTRTANRFAELVSRSPAKPVLALASDKRAAIAAAVDLLPDLAVEEAVDI